MSSKASVSGFGLREKDGAQLCASFDRCLHASGTDRRPVKLPTEGTVTAQGVLKSTFPLKSCNLRNVPVNNAECP